MPGEIFSWAAILLVVGPLGVPTETAILLVVGPGLGVQTGRLPSFFGPGSVVWKTKKCIRASSAQVNNNKQERKEYKQVKLAVRNIQGRGEEHRKKLSQVHFGKME